LQVFWCFSVICQGLVVSTIKRVTSVDIIIELPASIREYGKASADNILYEIYHTKHVIMIFVQKIRNSFVLVDILYLLAKVRLTKMSLSSSHNVELIYDFTKTSLF